MNKTLTRAVFTAVLAASALFATRNRAVTDQNPADDLVASTRVTPTLSDHLNKEDSNIKDNLNKGEDTKDEFGKGDDAKDNLGAGIL